MVVTVTGKCVLYKLLTLKTFSTAGRLWTILNASVNFSFNFTRLENFSEYHCIMDAFFSYLFALTCGAEAADNLYRAL